MKKTLQSLILSSITMTVIAQAESLGIHSNDWEKTLKLAEKGCKNGDEGACLVKEYAQEQLLLIKQLQSECNSNNFESCTIIGLKYFNGDGIKTNKPKAITLFTKACDNDFKEACTNLGMLYYHGNGVKKDKDKGIALLTKSCEDGDQYACEEKTKFESDTKLNGWNSLPNLIAAIGSEKAMQLFMDESINDQIIQQVIEKVNKVKKMTGKKELSDKEIDKIISEAKNA